MASKLLLAVSLVVPTFANDRGGFALRSRNKPRQLMGSAERLSHMWGRCDRWNRDQTGCTMKEEFTCASHLSDGPAEGDVEVHLGGFPASSPSDPVHVSWWAPRESTHEYDPLSSPMGTSLYGCMCAAYPQYQDADFNGGNIKVDENGEATLRVRRPSAYHVDRWIVFPHIHLRLCSNQSFIHNQRDAVFFSWGGPFVSGGCNSNGARYHVIKHRYIGEEWTFPAALDEDAPAPETTIPAPESTTILETTTSLGTTSIVTTTLTTTTLTASEAGVVDLRLRTAKDALDLDALEFSPIYQCFLDNLFFDHFSSECVQTCPADSEVVHGQCVRAEAHDEPVAIEAFWHLRVECGEVCWREKRNVTLHAVRLAVADHLDIPFQEVVSVDLSVITGRRLSEGALKNTQLFVHISSRRVEIDAHLNDFMEDASDASIVLGLTVRDMEKIEDEAAQDTTTAFEDPYAPAYNRAAPSTSTGAAASTSAISQLPLPAEAIIAIACAVVVLLSLITVYVRRRRMQQVAQIEEQIVEGVVAKKVEAIEEDDVKKAVHAAQECDLKNDAVPDPQSPAPEAGKPMAAPQECVEKTDETNIAQSPEIDFAPPAEGEEVEQVQSTSV